MQEPQIFSPQLGDIHGMLTICGVVFILFVWLAVRLNKNKHPDPRRRVLLPMLAYFMALLPLMFSLAPSGLSLSIRPSKLRLRR